MPKGVEVQVLSCAPMKKILLSISVILILGIGYWLVSPFFIDKKVSEELPVEVEAETFSGSFVGFDRIHYGSGNLKILKTKEGYIIRFEENFNIANGPDLYVGFGKDGEYKKGSEVSKLKGNIGSQNYMVPDHIDLREYNEVWIWCKAFSVGFAKARLENL